MKHGKKYVDAAKLVDKSKLYEPGEALETVIKTSTAKFDETVELHVKLGVDSRQVKMLEFLQFVRALMRSLQRKQVLTL